MPNWLFKGTSTRYAVCRPLTRALGPSRFRLNPIMRSIVLLAPPLLLAALLVTLAVRREFSAKGFFISYRHAAQIGLTTFGAGAFAGSVIGLLTLLGPARLVDDPHGTLYFYTAPFAALFALCAFYIAARLAYKRWVKRIESAGSTP